MRLDKFLKVSRIIKRRSVANELCDGGRVAVNGKTAKASYKVEVGDTVVVTIGERVDSFEVLSTVERPGKEAAALMFKKV
ncbi:MAG: RNA-binding S4 domain-containing protein [Ruminococcaceae bacterium]|nr:RNA-binding S4 domain-containing protein [Oscillospiraceae bacterium]